MMRRLTLLVLVVTAVLIPGKGRAQGGPTLGPDASAPGAVVMAGAKSRTITSDRTRLVVHEASAKFSHGTGRSVGMALSWLLLVTVVGFVLMAFGPDRLQIVVNTMQTGVGKSLGTGLLGQLLLLPAAVAVCVLLAATLIGVLLIPLGLMAFMLIVAGMAMFGFIAVATMAGAALTAGKQRDETPNGAMLRAFLTGSAIFMGIWVLAAALSGIPLVGAMAGSFASAVTFIAATTGFGAVLLSYWRGDFKRPA